MKSLKLLVGAKHYSSILNEISLFFPFIDEEIEASNY